MDCVPPVAHHLVKADGILITVMLRVYLEVFCVGLVI
jgi:hypothetical protein